MKHLVSCSWHTQLKTAVFRVTSFWKIPADLVTLDIWQLCTITLYHWFHRYWKIQDFARKFYYFISNTKLSEQTQQVFFRPNRILMQNQCEKSNLQTTSFCIQLSCDEDGSVNNNISNKKDAVFYYAWQWKMSPFLLCGVCVWSFNVENGKKCVCGVFCL